MSCTAAANPTTPASMTDALACKRPAAASSDEERPAKRSQQTDLRMHFPLWRKAHEVRTTVIADEKVRPITFDTSDILLIQAGCGMQKSFQSRKFIESLPEDSRIIFICVRRTHARDAHAQLETLGFEVYLDCKAKLKDVNRLCISPESLPRVQFSQSRPYDLVILDEVRTLCSCLCGSTIKDPDSITTLARICNSSRHVLAMDADAGLDGSVEEFLKGVTSPGVIARHVYPFQPLQRTVKIAFKTANGKAQIEPEIVKAIKAAARSTTNSKRVAIACMTPGDAKHYGRLCQEMSVPFKLYHGGTGHEHKQDFRDVDTAWKEARVIIFSATLTVGVDPRTSVFGKLFMVTCSKKCSSLRDLFQGICRFGRLPQLLSDTEITAYVDAISPSVRALRERTHQKEPRRPPLTFAAALKTVEKKYQQQWHLVARHLAKYVPEGQAPKLLDSWFHRLQAHIMVESAQDTDYHAEAFLELCKTRGWACVSAEAAKGGVERVTSEVTDYNLMTSLETYRAVRADILANDEEEAFWGDCCGLAQQRGVNEREFTTEENSKRSVFFAIKGISSL